MANMVNFFGLMIPDWIFGTCIFIILPAYFFWFADFCIRMDGYNITPGRRILLLIITGPLGWIDLFHYLLFGKTFCLNIQGNKQ